MLPTWCSINLPENLILASSKMTKDADPLVPVAPSLLRPTRPSQVSVASLVDASKFLGKEKMQLSVTWMHALLLYHGMMHVNHEVLPLMLRFHDTSRFAG